MIIDSQKDSVQMGSWNLELWHFEFQEFWSWKYFKDTGQNIVDLIGAKLTKFPK